MITVVISSYRYGHLAAHCVETILAQSKPPEKIIFVDDCAGDCSHIRKLYPEVQYIENPENYGTVKSFQNILMDRVSTEYCMFIGADNWLRSDAIQLMTSIISIRSPDIITYDVVLTGSLKETRVSHHREEVKRHEGDYYWDKTRKHHGSMLYKTELARKVGGYTKYNDTLNHTCEDWSLWNKMTKAEAKVAHIQQPLLYYRHHREKFNKY
jgi:glycosyltransferase involved in cell wall biosynthesis